MTHIKFINYNVKEMWFKLTPDIPNLDIKKILPKIRVDVAQVNNSIVAVVNASVDQYQETPSLFELKVNVVANFEIIKSGATIEEMKVEAGNFIFPYVRSIVTILTSLSNVTPPYFLPMIDFSAKEKRNPVEDESKRNGTDRVIVRAIDDEMI